MAPKVVHISKIAQITVEIRIPFLPLLVIWQQSIVGKSLGLQELISNHPPNESGGNGVCSSQREVSFWEITFKKSSPPKFEMDKIKTRATPEHMTKNWIKSENTTERSPPKLE